MARFSTGNSGKVTVGSGSTQILAAEGGRQYALLVNDSSETMYMNLGAAAVMNEGIPLYPNGGFVELKGENLFVGVIYAICASGSKNLTTFWA